MLHREKSILNLHLGLSIPYLQTGFYKQAILIVSVYLSVVICVVYICMFVYRESVYMKLSLSINIKATGKVEFAMC